MGSPISLFDNDPESRFLNLFNRFSDQSPEFGTYLEPDDPELLNYQKLASSPTGSEKLMSDYISRRPTREEYDPSLGRKMIAFLIGTLSGTGGKGAGEFVNRPFNQARSEWVDEGKNISSRARLIDTERNRELQALKFGLGTKERGLRAKAVDEYKRGSEARRLADEVASEEARKRAEEERLRANKVDENLAREIFTNRQQMQEFQKANVLEDNKRAADAAKAAEEARADKANSLELKNKHLAAYASQHGIDTSRKGTTALSLAIQLATQKASEHPAFKDLLVRDSKRPSGYKVITTKTDRDRILDIYVKKEAQKLLNGEF